MPYEGFVEVVKCGTARANKYLEAGYKLLHIGTESYEKELGNGDKYIQHTINLILGRPDDVAHIEVK